jgi:hypothetical protein
MHSNELFLHEFFSHPINRIGCHLFYGVARILESRDCLVSPLCAKRVFFLRAIVAFSLLEFVEPRETLLRALAFQYLGVCCSRRSWLRASFAFPLLECEIFVKAFWVWLLQIGLTFDVFKGFLLCQQIMCC